MNRYRQLVCDFVRHSTDVFLDGFHQCLRVLRPGSVHVAEAIIPLSGKRRKRGIELWEQTGEKLGVQPYANGGSLKNPGMLSVKNVFKAPPTVSSACGTVSVKNPVIPSQTGVGAALGGTGNGILGDESAGKKALDIGFNPP